MNPAPVFDRVYAGIKELLREGVVPPGEHLDPATLAAKLVASITPVRDALHRLAGERLVDAGNDGFAVLKMSEPDLRDLYDWNLQLLRLAIKTSLNSGFSYGAIDPAARAADQAAHLFKAIAARSPNLEHRLAVEAVNERLHAVRLIEPAILDVPEAELEGMARADLRTLRTLLGSYHRRRIVAVPQLIRALYRRQT